MSFGAMRGPRARLVDGGGEADAADGSAAFEAG